MRWNKLVCAHSTFHLSVLFSQAQIWLQFPFYLVCQLSLINVNFSTTRRSKQLRLPISGDFCLSAELKPGAERNYIGNYKETLTSCQTKVFICLSWIVKWKYCQIFEKSDWIRPRSRSSTCIYSLKIRKDKRGGGSLLVPTNYLLFFNEPHSQGAKILIHLKMCWLTFYRIEGWDLYPV